jgi:hypothetical protein
MNVAAASEPRYASDSNSARVTLFAEWKLENLRINFYQIRASRKRWESTFPRSSSVRV